MRGVLKRVFELKPPKKAKKSRWAFEEFGFWHRERENHPDPRYNRDRNNSKKKGVFILGLVRNPFSYYRSLYIMLQSHEAYENARLFLKSNGTQGFAPEKCRFHLEFKYSKTHLFVDDRNFRIASREYFVEFKDLILDHDSECREPLNIQGRHDDLMLMNDGSVTYDSYF